MKKLLSLLTVLALLLTAFAGCADSQKEIASMESSSLSESVEEKIPSPSEPSAITVHNIDEFLAALNSNTTIILSEGDYQLNQAETYGKDSPNPAYYWEQLGDEYQLVLNHLHDLTIRGAGIESTKLLTAPRYANIMLLDRCSRIHFDSLTAGHTDGSEMCTGGVIQLLYCKDIDFNHTGLFGCGVWGVNAEGCKGLTMKDCRIYSCSAAGIRVLDSTDLALDNCKFYALGDSQLPADSVISLNGCADVLINHCSVSENMVMHLLFLINNENVTVRDSEFRGNTVMSSAFLFQGMSPVLDGCTLDENNLRMWYTSRSVYAQDPQGNFITEQDLPPVPDSSSEDLPQQKVVHVTTADEFLEAIGSDTKIILDGAAINLTEAKTYGKDCSGSYHWEDIFDGPGLIIQDVNNFSIVTEGENHSAHSILSVPRYADVLAFRHCSNLTLSGFTAGHTDGISDCAGDVLGFSDCDHVVIDNCGLFGCGVVGVQADYSGDIAVRNCEIYDCSSDGIQMWNVAGITIEDNTFRNLGGLNLFLTDCSHIITDEPMNQIPDYE